MRLLNTSESCERQQQETAGKPAGKPAQFRLIARVNLVRPSPPKKQRRPNSAGAKSMFARVAVAAAEDVV